MNRRRCRPGGGRRLTRDELAAVTIREPGADVAVRPLRKLDDGGARLRLGMWHASARQAYLTPLAGGPLPSPGEVRRCVAELAGRGATAVMTAALDETEQQPFLGAGFVVRERLILLSHDLARVPSADPARLPQPCGAAVGVRVRRARRRDRLRVVEIDNRAFDEFWRLDAAGLEQSLAATPVSRLRVAARPEVVGYSLAGRSGRQGFVQRIAVDPSFQGHGVGRALLLDTLDWMRRRGTDRVLVNTQEWNVAALALYTGLGFVREPRDLAVLQLEVDGR